MSASHVPLCVGCGEKLRSAPFVDGYGKDGNGFFCTLRCGFRYAVRVAKSRG